MTNRDVNKELFAGIERYLESGAKPYVDGTLARVVYPYLYEDGYYPEEPIEALTRLKQSAPPPNLRLLDYGCGTGRLAQALRDIGYDYAGVDQTDTMVASQRAELEAGLPDGMSVYDGERIPFDDGYFGTVFSFQVLEHVDAPEAVFAEFERVLAPGGYVFSSLSCMEPVHGYSKFNMTPVAVKMLCERNGLELLRVHPLADIYSMMNFKLLSAFGHAQDAEKVSADRLSSGSHFNRLLIEAGERRGMRPKDINLLRLWFAGQFWFLAKKG